MDSSIAADPRFKLLARTLEISWREAIGSCYLLWLACYERRSERFSALEADVAAEIDGFAKALIGVGLAHDDGDGAIIVHGVARRITFLDDQAERGRKGGKSTQKRNRATAKQTLAERSTERKRSAKSYTPTPDQSPTPTPDPTVATPKAEPPVEALRLADGLRTCILEAQPRNRIGLAQNADDKWEGSSTRRKWAQEADRMHRLDERDWGRSASLIRWVWSPANLDAEATYVVESVASLRKKWDKIDAAKTRHCRKPTEPERGGPALTDL